MKKFFENFYLFSKLSTSLVLFAALVTMGYFFYKSYKNQDEIFLVQKNEETNIRKEIKNNLNQINTISNNLTETQQSLIQIKKLLEDNSKIKIANNNNVEFKQILEGINNNIRELSEEVGSIQKKINQTDSLVYENNSENIIQDKSKQDLINLILLKYENKIEFENELNALENLSTNNKNIFFEKLRITARKPYKGHFFLENQFQMEMENFIKVKLKKNSNNFLYKIILPYVKIEPAKENIIQDSEAMLMIEIEELIKNKKIHETLEKLKLINEYEFFYAGTVEQSQIYIEFINNLMELS